MPEYRDMFKNEEEELKWLEKRYDEIEEQLKDPDLFPVEQ